jgi:hypothetical protein
MRRTESCPVPAPGAVQGHPSSSVCNRTTGWGTLRAVTVDDKILKIAEVEFPTLTWCGLLRLLVMPAG